MECNSENNLDIYILIAHLIHTSQDINIVHFTILSCTFLMNFQHIEGASGSSVEMNKVTLRPPVFVFGNKKFKKILDFKGGLLQDLQFMK